MTPPHVTDDEAIARVDFMRHLAEDDKAYDRRCVVGEEKVYFVEDTKARAPGPIYSRLGLAEFQISQCCEYHFDQGFPDEDEDA